MRECLTPCIVPPRKLIQFHNLYLSRFHEGKQKRDYDDREHAKTTHCEPYHFLCPPYTTVGSILSAMDFLETICKCSLNTAIRGTHVALEHLHSCVEALAVRDFLGRHTGVAIGRRVERLVLRQASPHLSGQAEFVFRPPAR